MNFETQSCHIVSSASSTINADNVCSTTTCRAPDDAFISWADGAMTVTGEIRKEASIPIKSLPAKDES